MVLQLEQFGGPAPAEAGATLEQLAAGAAAIADIFVSKGFASKVGRPQSIGAVPSGWSCVWSQIMLSAWRSACNHLASGAAGWGGGHTAEQQRRRLHRAAGVARKSLGCATGRMWLLTLMCLTKLCAAPAADDHMRVWLHPASITDMLNLQLCSLSHSFAGSILHHAASA